MNLKLNAKIQVTEPCPISVIKLLYENNRRLLTVLAKKNSNLDPPKSFFLSSLFIVDLNYYILS